VAYKCLAKITNGSLKIHKKLTQKFKKNVERLKPEITYLITPEKCRTIIFKLAFSWNFCLRFIITIIWNKENKIKLV